MKKVIFLAVLAVAGLVVSARADIGTDAELYEQFYLLDHERFSSDSRPVLTQQNLRYFQNLAQKKIQEASSLRISEKAEKIANKLGSDNGKLRIKCEEERSRRGRWQTILISYHGRIVFKSMAYCHNDFVYRRHDIKEVVIYRPGEWLAQLEMLYKKAIEVKTEKSEIFKEIQDLKERFDLI